jgi:hypothetical protein
MKQAVAYMPDFVADFGFTPQQIKAHELLNKKERFAGGEGAALLQLSHFFKTVLTSTEHNTAS